MGWLRNQETVGDRVSTSICRASSQQRAPMKLHCFAVRANWISVFIECNAERRAKSRDAILAAMLWGAGPAETSLELRRY
jgi:hypothetical protein